MDRHGAKPALPTEGSPCKKAMRLNVADKKILTVAGLQDMMRSLEEGKADDSFTKTTYFLQGSFAPQNASAFEESAPMTAGRRLKLNLQFADSTGTVPVTLWSPAAEMYLEAHTDQVEPNTNQGNT